MKKLRAQLARFKVALIILGVVVIGLLLIIGGQNRRSDKLSSLSVETVQRRDVENVVSVEGYVTSVERREVYPPAQSKITTVIVVSEGDGVNKDDVIAKAETTDVYGRTEEEDILSPIDGVVVQINYSAGDFIYTPTTPLFVIAGHELEVTVNVNENDVVDLKSGLTAELVFPAVSLDDTYTGKLGRIPWAPNTSTGAIEYQIPIKPNSLPDKIRLGMSVDVEIVAAQAEDVVAVPESYLIENDGGYYVKVVNWLDTAKTDYELVEQEVETGLYTNRYVEITSGLDVGDEIVEPTFVVERAFDFF